MHFFTTLSKKPYLLFVLLLLLAVIFGFSIANSASLETNLSEYMPKTHPAFIFSDEAEELFGIGDSILIVLEDPSGIYNANTIGTIDAMTNTLLTEFPAIADVSSLTTADNIKSDDGMLEIEPFYTGETDELALTKLKESVAANPMIHGRIVSKDGTATLLIVEPVANSDTKTLQQELQTWIASHEGPQTLRIAGRPVVEGSMAELGPKDMAIMFPLVIVTMIILLYALLRSVRDTILNMIIVLLGTLAAFGTMTLFNVPIYAVDTMIPVMLIAIGVAYGIHMHNAIHHLMLTDPNITGEELARKSLKQMIRPVIMTAVTTAIGFVSLMSSEVLPVRYFGLFSAIGVLTEMFLALLLFPATIHLLGKPTYRKKIDVRKDPAFAKHLNRLVNAHPIIIVLIAFVVLVVGIWGTSKVWIDTSFLANFEQDSPIVQTDHFVNTKFGGTSTLNVILSSDEPDRFKDPELLSIINRMQTALEEDPMVGNTLALTTFIKLMNQVMTEYEVGSHSIPDSQELISQYLLLYEFSGDPKALEQVIDYEYMTANLTVQLKSDSSAQLKSILEIIDSYQPYFDDASITVGFAGSGYKAFVFSELLLKGQIISLLISFIIIFLLLTLLFKNWWIGLIGTAPIAITAVVNFAVMGILNIPLSSATALISSIAVGIGVDYAIHFLEHYTNERLRSRSIAEATLDTLGNTGRAILFNALAVMGGFVILLFSVFPPNRQVGSLIVLNMGVSAVATLTVMVVLIHFLEKKGRFFTKKLQNIQS
ncbi:MAG: MMPL family transporter [Sphaerochaeta sp.]|jgi:predicted RND superfamily exporter protein